MWLCRWQRKIWDWERLREKDRHTAGERHISPIRSFRCRSVVKSRSLEKERRRENRPKKILRREEGTFDEFVVVLDGSLLSTRSPVRVRACDRPQRRLKDGKDWDVVLFFSFYLLFFFYIFLVSLRAVFDSDFPGKRITRSPRVAHARNPRDGLRTHVR